MNLQPGNGLESRDLVERAVLGRRSFGFRSRATCARNRGARSRREEDTRYDPPSSHRDSLERVVESESERVEKYCGVTPARRSGTNGARDHVFAAPADSAVGRTVAG
jgi:hypothetical protein